MLSLVMADDLNMKLIHLENKAKLTMDLANGSSVNLKVKLEYDPMKMSQASKRIHRSQNGLYDRNRLPACWLDCPSYGNAFNFIIPLKLLLKEFVNDKIVIEKRCSPQQAILQRRRIGRELGLVIDLTNTDRYCLKSDWTQEGIEHVKSRPLDRLMEIEQSM
nr:mRNA-capping enzyme [Tanacetum cinerariifolium]